MVTKRGGVDQFFGGGDGPVPDLNFLVELYARVVWDSRFESEEPITSIVRKQVRLNGSLVAGEGSPYRCTGFLWCLAIDYMLLVCLARMGHGRNENPIAGSRMCLWPERPGDAGVTRLSAFVGLDRYL